MDVYDFFRALHKATADSVIYFGEIIKKRYNGHMLTGSFYGSAACEKVFDFSQITTSLTNNIGVTGKNFIFVSFQNKALLHISYGIANDFDSLFYLLV